MMDPTKVSDILFVAGVLLSSFAGLSLISSKGGFSALGYVWYWITDGLSRKNVTSPRKDYYTYQKEFSERKKKSGSLLHKVRLPILGLGLLFILVSLVIALSEL